MTETEHAERQDFEALVRRHQAQVCAVAYAVLHDRERAQEVAQDAFLIAWRGRASMVPSVRWICGIARNHARNVARRRTEAPMTDDPATTALDPRDELITREDAARAHAALARLPQRYREAVILYYGGDESIADVASALGIRLTRLGSAYIAGGSVSASCSHLSRRRYVRRVRPPHSRRLVLPHGLLANRRLRTRPTFRSVYPCLRSPRARLPLALLLPLRRP